MRLPGGRLFWKFFLSILLAQIAAVTSRPSSSRPLRSMA